MRKFVVRRGGRSRKSALKKRLIASAMYSHTDCVAARS
jgi:hypothetical protein